MIKRFVLNDCGPSVLFFAKDADLVANNTLPSYTTDQAAQQLTRYGGSWNGPFVTGTPATVTYAFRATAPGTMPLDMSGFSQLSATQIAAAELALQSWADVANITFVRVNPGGYSNNAQMLFSGYTSGTAGAAAFGFSPSNPDPNKAGDVWFKSTYSFNLDPYLLSYGRHLLVHEIGHALGFAHPGNYDVTNGSPTYAADAVYREDTQQYSVMSYWSPTNTGADFQDYYPSAPMLHDIAAAQRLYGMNMSTRTGDTVYGFNSNADRDYYSAANASQEVIFAVWDAGGTDTLDFSLYAAAQLINLNAESFSNVGGLVGNVSIAQGVVIENAVGGSGSDTIIGNGANNSLAGGGGADTLSGGIGSDTLAGGAGGDTFYDTSSNLTGDTIIGFGIGDRIAFNDAIAGQFTFSISGNTLTYSGGSLTLSGFGGQMAVSASAGGAIELRMILPDQFSGMTLATAEFGAAAGSGGWSSDDRFPRELADVNADGRADIVGFGNAGVYVSLAQAGGSYSSSGLVFPAFGASSSAGGWASDNIFHREMADVNGDNRADIVGFGEAGVYVALASSSSSFGPSFLAINAFGTGGTAGSWSSYDLYARELADANGDGRADIVGFGEAGVYVALANADGSFAAPLLNLQAFGVHAIAGGWSSSDDYPRLLADLNGDSRADIVGFGNAGVYVSLADSLGNFETPTFTLAEFGKAPSGGDWSSGDLFPRLVADVNADGYSDIVGFGNSGVYVAYGHGDGTFENSVFDANLFGAATSAGGWASYDVFPRHLADVNNDGAADIVGFGNAGAFTGFSDENYWL